MQFNIFFKFRVEAKFYINVIFLGRLIEGFIKSKEKYLLRKRNRRNNSKILK